MVNSDETPAMVRGGRITSKSGGDIELDPEEPMAAPGGLRATEYGAAFGPLEIIAYPGSTARLSGLRFKPEASALEGLFGSSEGDGLFATLGLLAACDADTAAGDEAEAEDADQKPGLSRRELLRVGALSTALTGGTLAAVVRGQTDTTYTRAQFAVPDNPMGIRTRVLDRVEGYLPPSKAYYSFVNGQSYQRFQAGSSDSYGDILPEQTGDAVVGPKGSAGGLLSRIRADKTQVYEGLALSKPTGDAETGETITITTNDIIVENAKSAGESQTIVTLNGKSIPHASEDRASERGYYEVSDGVLVYSVGTSAPSVQTATLTLWADRSSELYDDVLRTGDLDG